MMTQALELQSQGLDPWELPAVELPTSPQAGTIRHTFVLFNPLTIDEQVVTIETETPFYTEVHHELEYQKSQQNLMSYTVRRILESPCGF